MRTLQLAQYYDRKNSYLHWGGITVVDTPGVHTSTREDQYPVNNWLNDIFGARIILTAGEIQSIMDLLDDWQDALSLKKLVFA